MSPRSVLEIDLSAVEQNLGAIRAMVGQACTIGAIVKANAYGLGAARLVAPMQRAGVGRFIVFAPEEARSLIQVGADRPILILMPVSGWRLGGDLEQALRRGQVELVVHSRAQLEALSTLARRRGCHLPVHLELDTGMSRGGVGVEEGRDLLHTIARSDVVSLRGVLTHFAAAESDPRETDRQAGTLDDFIDHHADLMPKACLVHTANSFAMLRDAAHHRCMVRVGLTWAGYGPEWMEHWDRSGPSRPLRPVLTWRSGISHVRQIEAGVTVGYGCQWTARRPSRIGVVPVGYADGYPASLGATDGDRSRAVVRISTTGSEEAVYAPVVGAVNMDQITVDLTEVPARILQAAIVEIVTPEPKAPNHLPSLARLAGTIPHVLMSQLHPRLARSYVTADYEPHVEIKSGSIKAVTGRAPEPATTSGT